jgi:hypothetical protein
MNADRWEDYALPGGALMNPKHYEEEPPDRFAHDRSGIRNDETTEN